MAENNTKMTKSRDLLNPTSSEWNESDHPRNEDGEFADKGKSDISDVDKALGSEYKGYKGQQAIDKLMLEKKGHIKAAFYREDIGDIDLLWGDKTFGLQHIIERRNEQGIETTAFLNNIAEVVEQGIFYKKNERGNFEFWKDGKMVIIAPEYHKNKITYLLTAYKRTKIKAP